MCAAALQLDIATLSERGGRSENQDTCGHWLGDDSAYVVVCDGAGGHLGGAIASKVAAGAALDALRASAGGGPEALEAALRKANEALVREQEAQPEYSQMRTTIVALAIDRVQGSAAWGHLGDSRLYCFRAGRIVRQTRDHSVVQSLVDAGYLKAGDLRTSPDRSKLLSALGDADQFEPAVERAAFSLAAGDSFLLCTDGLWEYVQESEMEQALETCADTTAWLEALQRYVVSRGTRKHDNYSAVAVWCRPGI